MRFPCKARQTANGRMLLVYQGGARYRTHWKHCPIFSPATQRRFRWRVHVGGKP